MSNPIAAAAAALVLLSGPALAQKSADTIRIAINDTFAVLDEYHFASDEAGAFDRSVYQPLITYDEHAKKWVNVLASSWKRIDPKTIEFELRENAVFHNGNKFSAADVKATFDYLADPKVNIRFKERYDWVEQVEILGPHKVRVIAKRPMSTALGLLAYRMRIHDGTYMKTLSDIADYGKAPVGTGHWKVTSIGRNEGLVLERVETFWGDAHYYPAPLKRVRGVFMPDRQTQSAQLLTGGIDLMRNITADDATNLSKQPNIGVTPTSSSMLLYVTLDAAGRSKNKAMTDPRVRKAFMMAIDRKLLQQSILPGGDIAATPETVCWRSMIACEVSTTPYGYNPTEAKRLLAEAGFPNGFDLHFDAHEPVKYVAEAMAGELRKVGIRASIEALPNAAYVRKRGDGEFTAFTGFYPAGTHPDAQVMLSFFFESNRDYWQDPVIAKAAADGEQEFDDLKRGKIYQAAFDRVNEGAYIFPVSELPIVWAHHKDVFVKANPLTKAVPILGDYGWKH